MKKTKLRLAPPTPHSVWTDPWQFIACGFGVGAIPFMPGTFGTLVGVLFYLVLIKFSLWTYLIVTAIFVFLGIWLCDYANRDFGTDDHPAAVWDEIAAFLIVMIAVPPTWYYLLIGFLLFRFFDIVKPGPIGWLDKHVHGGVGVMLDDVAAALVSLAILQAVVWFF